MKEGSLPQAVVTAQLARPYLQPPRVGSSLLRPYLDDLNPGRVLEPARISVQVDAGPLQHQIDGHIRGVRAKFGDLQVNLAVGGGHAVHAEGSPLGFIGFLGFRV